MARVWLDDERPLPAAYDTHVKTAAEAIALIDAGQVELISLDNDLGPPEAGQGRDVAAHIEAMAFLNRIPRIRCRVHTQNPVARQGIVASLQNADRFWMDHEHAEDRPDGLLQD